MVFLAVKEMDSQSRVLLHFYNQKLQLELCSPELYVETLTPVPANVFLFGNRVFVDMIKLR
jgi:hypothetical protein